MPGFQYTAEHIAFLAENITGCYYSDLTEKFNRQFGTNLSTESIKSFSLRHGLRSGCTAGGKVGRKAWNKGKHGFRVWNKGKCGFVKEGSGSYGPNCMPVGTEGVNNGYISVKTDGPSRWQPKHLVIWEKVYGSIPPGHVLIFADGDKRNVTLDNLILVTRNQLLRMNERHLRQDDPNLTRSGVIVADIIIKCAERKRRSKTKNIKEDKINEK